MQSIESAVMRKVFVSLVAVMILSSCSLQEKVSLPGNSATQAWSTPAIPTINPSLWFSGQHAHAPIVTREFILDPGQYKVRASCDDPNILTVTLRSIKQEETIAFVVSEISTSGPIEREFRVESDSLAAGGAAAFEVVCMGYWSINVERS